MEFFLSPTASIASRKRRSSSGRIGLTNATMSESKASPMELRCQSNWNLTLVSSGRIGIYVYRMSVCAGRKKRGSRLSTRSRPSRDNRTRSGDESAR